jgi:hypothetical protein
MPTLKNFEDLKAWQKARELAGCVYALNRKQHFSRDLVYVARSRKQQARACTILPKALHQAMTLSSYGF